MSSLSIRVEGLAETLKGLREIDRELPKEVKRGLREDVRPFCSLSIICARPRRLPGSTPPTPRCGPYRRA